MFVVGDKVIAARFNDPCGTQSIGKVMTVTDHGFSVKYPGDPEYWEYGNYEAEKFDLVEQDIRSK